MKEPPVSRGDVLAGKYRVESVLGVGGMGMVVAVTHLELLEQRAVKLMLPRARENAGAVERFLREARAASRLSSEHVARVHDVGRLDDGAPYMVMEYLAGADLRAILERRGRLPAAEAVLYALQACEALAEAHASGIVHRDLKPANLFLTSRRDGSPCVKVLDFGISKVLDRGDPEMTTTQAVLGSPTYMSPEQMRSARDVDARTDVWSLGVILYRLVTGLPPFRAGNLTELVALVLSTPPDPPSALVPGLPAGFDEVLLRCLERDLDRRFAGVGDLARALLPFAPEEGRASVDRIARTLAGGGRIPSVRPPRVPSLPGTHPPWSRTPLASGSISMRRWTFVALTTAAGGLAISGAVALGVSIYLRRPRPAAPPEVTAVTASAAVTATAGTADADADADATSSDAGAPEPTPIVTPAPLDPLPEPAAAPAPEPTGAPRPVRWWKKPTAAGTIDPPRPAPTAPHRMFGADAE